MIFWKRSLFLLLSITISLFLALLVALFILQKTTTIKSWVQQALAKSLPYSIALDDAWISLWGPTLQIQELRIFDELHSRALARIPHAVLQISINPFSKNFLQPCKIIVSKPYFEIPKNFSLPRQTVEQPSSGVAPLAHIPEIYIEELSASIQLSEDIILPTGKITLMFLPIEKGGGNFQGVIDLPTGSQIPIAGAIDANGRPSLNSAGQLHFSSQTFSTAQTTNSLWRKLELSGDLLYQLLFLPDAGSPIGFTANLDLELQNLTAKIPNTPLKLEAIAGRISLRSNSGGYGDLQGKWEETTWQARADLHLVQPWDDFALDAYLFAQNLPFDPRLRKLTDTDRALRQIWEAFTPEGLCDLSLRATKKLDQDIPRFQARLKLKELNALFAGFPANNPANPEQKIGFPLPIHSLTGEIIYRFGHVVLRQLQGDIGGAKLGVEGSLSGTKNAAIDIQVSIEKLALDAATQKALHSLPGAAQIWDSLRPSGLADFNIRLQRNLGENQLRASGKITALDAKINYVEFPVEVSACSGEIFFKPHQFRFQVTGQANQGTVAVRGSVVHKPEDVGAAPAFKLFVKGSNIHYDDSLKNAMFTALPSIENTWKQINPSSGILAGEIRIWPNQILASITPADFTLRPNVFPQELNNIDGLFVVETQGARTRIVADSLLGAAEKSPLLFSAYFLHGQENQESSEIHLQALDLPVATDLFQKADSAGLPASSFLKQFLWDGVIDLNYYQKKNRDLVEETKAEIEMYNVALVKPDENLNLYNINGDLSIHNNQLSFEQISAMLGSGFITLTAGNAQLNDSPLAVDFTAHTYHFPLDQKLDSFLTHELAQKIQSFGLHGNITLDPLRCHLELPNQGDIALHFQGVIHPQKVTTSGALPLEILSAEIFLEDGLLQGDSIQTQGTVNDAEVILLSRVIDKLNAKFEIANQWIRFYQTRGNLYEGRLESGQDPDIFRIHTIPPNDFHIDMQATGINLKKFLRDLAGDANNFRGELSFALQMTGNQENRNSWVGSGNLEIRDGQLWEVPLLNRLLKLIGLSTFRENPPVFHRGDLSFQIQDQKVIIEKMGLQSTPLDLAGAGTIALDGKIDMDIQVKSLTPIPLIGQIFSGLIRALFSIKVVGNVLAPDITLTGGSAPEKSVYIPSIKKERKILD